MEGTLATNKQGAAGQKKATATREQLLTDVRRIHKVFPDAVITRDFYRQHGGFLERTWSLYWPKFSDMVREAGCEPAKPVIEVVKDIPVADKLDFELKKIDAKKDDSKKLLGEAAKRIKALEEQNAAFLGLQGQQVQTYEIQPKVPSGHSEAVAFMIASDWHNEERVRLSDVSNQNEFNLDIFKRRSDTFFKGGQRLWDILRKDTQIKTLVLALLGDFITGSIHEDAAESNYLPPAEAIWNAEEKIASGIRFLLENTDVEEIAIPCHSGNHGRMTKKQRHSTEQGNSLEQYMYKHLEAHFANEPRVKFMISGGYLSYMTLFDKYTIRFHHG